MGPSGKKSFDVRKNQIFNTSMHNVPKLPGTNTARILKCV